MKEVSVSCIISLSMSSFYKQHERWVSFLNPHSRALLWLLLAHPPLQFPLRCVVPELSWPNPLFHRWGNCNPDWGRDLPQISRGVRGRARTRTWAFGVLSTPSPWAVSFPCLLESVSIPRDGSFCPFWSRCYPHYIDYRYTKVLAHLLVKYEFSWMVSLARGPKTVWHGPTWSLTPLPFSIHYFNEAPYQHPLLLSPCKNEHIFPL